MRLPTPSSPYLTRYPFITWHNLAEDKRRGEGEMVTPVRDSVSRTAGLRSVGRRPSLHPLHPLLVGCAVHGPLPSSPLSVCGYRASGAASVDTHFPLIWPCSVSTPPNYRSHISHTRIAASSASHCLHLYPRPRPRPRPYLSFNLISSPPCLLTPSPQA